VEVEVHSEMEKFYITTAIDYANGAPHLGHAYEKIGADVIARYHRAIGRTVHFAIGMDEHGHKVAQSAGEAGVTPQQLVDDLAQNFSARWRALSISHDQFVRTSAEQHKAGVRALLERIFERSPDDFYERTYTGLYCIGCESFKQPAEVVDGKCAIHPTRVLQPVEERNWFFRLSRYRDFLTNHIRSNTHFVQPESRRNEILALLDGGLDDVSASRARLDWAVPFPRKLSDGEQQGTYVWFDALPNYLTATGFPDHGFEKRWPAQLHIIGKDITRFHCLIWPAMLKAAELQLPERVWAHGFVLTAGERFSKSSGVRVDLDEVSNKHGVDAFRYFLMREVPFDNDGSFSWERFEERYNSDLANALGNLASRTISMVERYRGGVTPSATGPAGEELDRLDAADIANYHACLNGERGYLLHEALQHVWKTVACGNEFVDRKAPWKLAKDPSLAADLDTTLAALVRQLARHAVHLAPFLPSKMEEMWVQLGAPFALSSANAAKSFELRVDGWRVSKGSPLFPKDVEAK
jgi:methionyl-tRNA synthetase